MQQYFKESLAHQIWQMIQPYRQSADLLALVDMGMMVTPPSGAQQVQIKSAFLTTLILLGLVRSIILYLLSKLSNSYSPEITPL